MASTEDPKGADAPKSESSPETGATAPTPEQKLPSSSEQTVEAAYTHPDDTYPYEDTSRPAAVAEAGGGGSAPPPPPPPPDEEDDGEDGGMLRMSFLEHLEELRSRLIKMLVGVGVAFLASLTFSDKLWLFVQEPAHAALQRLGIKPPNLVAIDPMDQFNIVWVKLPILAAVFLASPWVLYQIWGFIAPGLYKRERRWAAPFVTCTAGLFIAGGCFAYFVAFRFGLEFLLGIGMNINITPMVGITYYFDLFVNVILGVALVFEMPVLIFFLTLLRITTPKFLLAQSRYAILIIVLIAAVVTPTPDIFNMMLFAVPMVLLFYVGIFASYLLTLNRAGEKFPWSKVFYIAGVVALAAAGLIYFAIAKYGYHFVKHWPFLIR